MKIRKWGAGLAAILASASASSLTYQETFDSAEFINTASSTLVIAQSNTDVLSDTANEDGVLGYATQFEVVSDFTDAESHFTLSTSGAPALGSVNAIVPMHVNADNLLDALLFYGSGEVRLWENAEAQVPTQTVSAFSLQGDAQWYASLALDVNADGIDDCVVSRSGQLDVYANVSGQFTHTTTLASPYRVRTLLAQDVDFDGLTDVVVINDSAPAQVHYNRDGVLLEAVSLNDDIRASFDGVFADINGDGVDDLLKGNFEQVNSLLLGTESGFLSERDFELMRSSTQHIAVLDMTGDGYPDVWESNAGQNVLFQSTDEGFVASVVPSSAPSLFTAVVDMENDGVGEVLEVIPGEGIVLSRFNEAADTQTLGTVTVSTLISAPDVEQAAFADVNQDGFFDMILAESSSTRVLLNRVTQTDQLNYAREGVAESVNINSQGVNVGAVYFEVTADIPDTVSAKYLISVDGGRVFRPMRDRSVLTYETLQVAPDVRWRVELDGGSNAATPAVSTLKIELVERVLSEKDVRNFNKVLPKAPGDVITNEAGALSPVLWLVFGLVFFVARRFEHQARLCRHLASRTLSCLAGLVVASASHAVFDSPVRDGFIAEHNISGQHANVIDLQSGNFNGDSQPDLLVVNNAQPNQVYVTTALGFAFSATVESLGYDHTQGAVGDIDGDGLDDVAIATATGLRIYRNTTDVLSIEAPVQFELSEVVLTQYITTVEFADLDQDDDIDVVFAARNQPVSWLENNAGVLQAPERLTSEAMDTQALAIWDVNHDGANDVVLANDGPNAALYSNDSGGYDFISLHYTQQSATLTTGVFAFRKGLFSDILFIEPQANVVLEGVNILTVPPESVIAQRYVARTLSTSVAGERVVAFADIDGYCGADLLVVDADYGASWQLFSQGERYGTGFQPPSDFFQARTDAIRFSSVVVDDFDDDDDLDFIVGGSGDLRFYNNLGLMYQTYQIVFENDENQTNETREPAIGKESPLCEVHGFLLDFINGGGGGRDLGDIDGGDLTIPQDIQDAIGEIPQDSDIPNASANIGDPQGQLFDSLFSELGLRVVESASIDANTTESAMIGFDSQTVPDVALKNSPVDELSPMCVQQSGQVRCFARTGDTLALSARFADSDLAEGAEIRPFILGRDIAPEFSGENNLIVSAQTQVLPTDPDGEVAFGIYATQNFGELYDAPTDDVRIIIDNAAPEPPVFVDPRQDEQLQVQRVMVSGYSSEKGNVNLHVNDQSICEAQVRNTFEWECELDLATIENTIALDSQIQSLTLMATSVDFAGNTSAPATLSLTAFTFVETPGRVETVESTAGGTATWSMVLGLLGLWGGRLLIGRGRKSRASFTAHLHHH